MGPRLVNRGNEIAQGVLFRSVAASMGPRLVNRGNVLVMVDGMLVLMASMGPRLVNRGNLPYLPVSAICYWRFNGAAIS